MAIKDFFRAKPDPDREPTLRDRDQILAWLEELARIRTPLELKVQEKDLLPIPAKVEVVAEESSALTLSLQRIPAPEPKAGQIIHVVFPLDGQRFRTDLVYRGRGGYMQCVFALPEAIYHAERREAIRARFGTREKTQVVALEGLFEGVGLGGQMVNLSLGGCAFRLQRAMDIRGDRRLPLRHDLLIPGTQLALLRLQDLPHLPLVECGGVVAHVDQRTDGLIMGVRFEGLGSFESQVVGRVLTQRVPGFRRGFPRKRRHRDLTEEELKRPQAPEDPLPEEMQEPDELQPPSDADVALSDEELQELRETVRVPNRLNLLRKRGKRILLLMGDELDRAILMATLHVDGFRSVYEATSLEQALELNCTVAFEMVIVDQKVGEHGALDLVEALRAEGLTKGAPVVVLQRHEEVRLKVASKAGGISLILQHPVDFDGLMKPALEGLLGLVG
jgi:CheY-like chemotaxis protein